MKVKKLIASIFLCAAVICCTASVTGFADGDVAATITRNESVIEYDNVNIALSAVQDGDVVTFKQNLRTFTPAQKANVTYTCADGVELSGRLGSLPAIEGSVTFKDITFANNAIGQYGSSEEYKGLDVVFEDCTINNAGGNCMYIQPEINSLTVSGCTFNAPEGGSGAQYLVWPYYANAIVIENNVFNGNGTRGAIHLGDQTETAVVSGNTINNFERGVNIALTYGGSVDIDNNIFSEIKVYSDVQGRTAPVYLHENTNQNVTEVAVNNNSINDSSEAVFGETGDFSCVYSFTGNIINGVDSGELSGNTSGYAATTASNGEKYATLAAAIENAEDNDTVTLLSDVEFVLPDSADSAGLVPQININKSLTLDLAGYTIGYDQSVSDKSLTYTPAFLGILEGDVTITGDGKIDCEAGMNNAFGINVNGGNLTVENGTFLGAITAVQVQKGSLTVNGGVFDLAETVKEVAPEYAKYIINAIDAAYKDNSAAISVTGGSFIGFDPSDNPEGEGTSYVADGYSTKNINGSWVIDESAGMLTIGFNPTADDRVYDIVVNADDAQIINRLNTADLTFRLTPSSADDCSVDYEIVEADKMSLINPSENRYEFHFNGKEGVTTDTGASVTIGQVRFNGYTKNDATVTFEVVLEDSLVTATSVSDNIVTYFSADGGTLSMDDANVIENKEFAIPTHYLTVNIDFNNNISDNPSEYQQMTATISGGDLEAPIVKKFGSDAENGSIGLSGNSYSFTEALSENTAYTVTIEGDGYRTARYTVTMTGDKTLSFWNNVMDTAQHVETITETQEGVGEMRVTTYLAGDIVMNNVIDIYDLSAVVAYFGTVELNGVNAPADANDYIKYDLNRDGKIDSKDVAMVLVSWGE